MNLDLTTLINAPWFPAFLQIIRIGLMISIFTYNMVYQFALQIFKKNRSFSFGGMFKELFDFAWQTVLMFIVMQEVIIKPIFTIIFTLLTWLIKFLLAIVNWIITLLPTL